MTLAAIYDVPAPAKLNLFLHVVGRRPDGYHLLQSVFVLIDWCDTLHFERRGDGRLQRHDLGPVLPADDLSLRAARALQQASGTPLGADLSVHKQVPWGAGLGGGSSDAASTLLALNRLWGLNWPREQLLRIALPLGADVPFFVAGQNAFVEGIGEHLTPLPPLTLALADRCYAVLKPGPAIATSAVFASPQLVRDTKPVTVMSFLAKADLGELLAAGYGCNDLQATVELSCPELAQAAQWLDQNFGNSRMSGSGSAVFARTEFARSEFARTEFARTVANPRNLQDAGKSVESIDLTADSSMSPVTDRLIDLAGDQAGKFPPGCSGRLCFGLDHHPLLGWAN